MAEESARVTMLWPERLKDRVREKVGNRGLTSFAISAVEAKLAIYDEHREDAKRINELRFLAQQLADAIAMRGSEEFDAVDTLQEIGLPDWIDTTGWPDDLAQLVKPEDSTPEPVSPPFYTEPVSIDFYTVDLDSEQPDSPLAQPPAAEPEPEPESEPVDDLLARVRAKALEKGVDLSDVSLTPASQVPAPVQTPVEMDEEPEVAVCGECGGVGCPVCNNVGQWVAAPAVEPVAEPTVNPNACPNCGSELVGGECWECM